ncbi:MAG: NAD(P)H-hydrate epimerase [Planctomycetota bacterium]
MISKSVAQLQEIDRKCESEYGIQPLILMEHAGKGAAEIIITMNPLRRTTLVVAGLGNNGGDGFVAARHLRLRKYPVRICLLGSAAKMQQGSIARINFEILKRMKIPVTEIIETDSIDMLEKEIRNAGFIVDALFGIGLKGEVRQSFAAIINTINNSEIPIISLDVPSGLDADTGISLGTAITAAQTITFVANKNGFLDPKAEKYTGKVTLVDIGVPPELLEEL